MEVRFNNVEAAVINLSYSDQLAYPPADGQKLFDAEAMIFHNDSLHIFTKDRTTPYLGITRHYVCPTVEGNYVLQPKGTYAIGQFGSYIFSVTGADISPDGTQLALINADRIWLFSNYTGTDFFNGDVQVLNLGFVSQKEGVAFRNGFLYFTDEVFSGIGGNLYRIHPDVIHGISAHHAPSNIRAVYNESGEFLYVDLPKNSGFTHWKLLTANGQLVGQAPIATNSAQQLKLPLLEAGLYVIQTLNEYNQGISTLLRVK